MCLLCENMVLLDGGENMLDIDTEALHIEWELLEAALDCMINLQKSHAIIETMQGVVSSTEPAFQEPHRTRKRKSNSEEEKGCSKVKKQPVPSPECPTICTSEVMLVGEPTLMGGKFGNEDERIITRLKNTQYSNNSNDTKESDLASHSDQPTSVAEVPGAQSCEDIKLFTNEQTPQLSEDDWFPIDIKRTSNSSTVKEKVNTCDGR